MFPWLILPDFYPNENQVQHPSRLCVNKNLYIFMMGTYGTCWDILQILPWQITIKPLFVEHILIIFQPPQANLAGYKPLLSLTFFWPAIKNNPVFLDPGGVRYSLTFSAPENGWLEHQFPFVARPIFSGFNLLVSGSVTKPGIAVKKTRLHQVANISPFAIFPYRMGRSLT